MSWAIRKVKRYLTVKIKHIGPLKMFGLLVIAGALLLQFSCIGLKPGADKKSKPALSGGGSEEAQIFQSENYIVYGVVGGETPVILAKKYLGDEKKAWMIEDENKGAAFEKGRWIIIPLKDQNKGGLQSDGYQVVPILSYHNFAEKCGAPLCTPRKIFQEQMKYLRDNGYRVITMKALLGFLEYRHGIPEQSVVITIEDGYRSFYKIAYPILKSYGYPATLFVYTDFMENAKKGITWDQLRKIKADGFEVGSNCISRTDLSKKMEKEEEVDYLKRVKNELVLSKKAIDKNLRQKTLYLAFPYGGYNQIILRFSEEAGYKIGLSMREGSNPFFADPLSLKRKRIIHRDMKRFIAGLETFKKFSLE